MLAPQVVAYNAQLEAEVLTTTETGACVFYDEGCALHRELGPMGKPGGCRRFPFRLVATPVGGRIVTEHRCPCRTMGDRPPLSMQEAEEAVRDEAGRIRRDMRVGDRLHRTRKATMSFSSYAREEASWLARILAGEDVGAVLDAEPFPPIAEATWTDVAHEMRSRLDGTACSEALAWFGDVILDLHGTKIRSLRRRPWAPAFDRAQARTPKAGRADDVLGDWAADALWSIDWAQVASLKTGRADLVTRATVARTITEKLRRSGVRADRAAAEAVMIVEIAAASGLWGSVLRSIDRAGG